MIRADESFQRIKFPLPLAQRFDLLPQLLDVRVLLVDLSSLLFDLCLLFAGSVDERHPVARGSFDVRYCKVTSTLITPVPLSNVAKALPTIAPLHLR